MESKVIIFHNETAEIIHTENITPYEGKPNVLINPVFPPGVPPHHWRLMNGKIGFHSPQEVARRESILHGDIAAPEIIAVPAPTFPYLIPCAASLATGIGLTLLFELLLKFF